MTFFLCGQHMNIISYTHTHTYTHICVVSFPPLDDATAANTHNTYYHTIHTTTITHHHTPRLLIQLKHSTLTTDVLHIG